MFPRLTARPLVERPSPRLVRAAESLQLRLCQECWEPLVAELDGENTRCWICVRGFEIRITPRMFGVLLESHLPPVIEDAPRPRANLDRAVRCALRQLRSERPCARCAQSPRWFLRELHHVHPWTKGAGPVDDIPHALRRIIEVPKCIVLCVACHRTETHYRGRLQRQLGQLLDQFEGGRRYRP